MKYLLFLLLSIGLKAQTFTGVYTFRINSIVPSISNMRLTSSNNKTWEVMVKKNYLTDEEYEKKGNDKGVVVGNIADNYKVVDTDKKPEFYKDAQTNELFSRNFYMAKECYIKEDIPHFKWEMDGEIDYNGKKYNVAKSSFRGVNWILYFDSTSKFNVAPWKFYGLPGLVVYAKSSDNYFIYELQEYNIDPDNIILKNPFEKEKMISWDNYKKNYKDYLKKLLKRMDANDEDGNKGSIKINNVIEDLGFTEVK